MEETINRLMQMHSVEDIEHAIIQNFVAKRDIKVSHNRLLLSILNRQIDGAAFIASNIMFPEDIGDLVKFFELLIPLKDRKLNGAFFTPRLITEYMADEVIDSPDSMICDPSCGCGAFLLAAAMILKNKFGNSMAQIIKENLFGVDILSYSAERSKVLLSLLAALNGEDEEEYQFNVRSADSLCADWAMLFPQSGKAGGFDIVIGNPPYVKYQDLPIEQRKSLFQNWKTLKTGTYNLYFAFFELALQIINDSGRLAYIVPNNYFTSLAGLDLRILLQHGKLIDKIINFNHLRIFSAQTYTCITFASKKAKPSFFYERVEEPSSILNLKNLKFSTIKYEDLNTRKWRLLREEDQANVRTIESFATKLGDIVDIRVGIATCKDQIYFIDGGTLKAGYFEKEYNGTRYLVEREITKPIVKISDFDNQENLQNNQRRIIFPYKISGRKAIIIPELELSEKHPRCYEYLLACKHELQARDKGNGDYSSWYAYARTQGLSFHGEKLLTPTFSEKPRFLFDSNKESLFCNGYGLYEKQTGQIDLGRTLSLRAIQKILSSSIMDYYVSRTSFTIEGGYPCYQKNFIEFFGIPEFTGEEVEYIENENNLENLERFLHIRYGLCPQGSDAHTISLLPNAY